MLRILWCKQLRTDKCIIINYNLVWALLVYEFKKKNTFSGYNFVTTLFFIRFIYICFQYVKDIKLNITFIKLHLLRYFKDIFFKIYEKNSQINLRMHPQEEHNIGVIIKYCSKPDFVDRKLGTLHYREIINYFVNNCSVLFCKHIKISYKI